MILITTLRLVTCHLKKYKKIELPRCIVDWGTFVPQPYSVENKKVSNAKVKTAMTVV